MPRIPHSLLLKAYNKAPFLPLVLRGSRALPLAINELRWLIEYVLETSHQKGPKAEYKQLLHLCKRRSKGEPLQYILGSQPFGNLDIKCRPGVLIPRPETEAYTSYLGHLISSQRLNRLLLGRLRHGNDPAGHSGKRAPALIGILDLCTGSGCIPILLNSLLSEYPGRIKIYGWDISEESIALSKANWAHNVRLGQVKENPQKPVSFEVVNIFDHETKLLDILAKQSHRRLENAKVDIIVSNPPYISQESFRTETTRSVRNWEPKLALVPENLHPETMAMGCAAADIFYQRLLYLYSLFRARVLLMEVGDEAQAVRVAQMALSSSRIRRTTKGRDVVEIWRDSPDTGRLGELKIGGDKVSVRGTGGLRAVVLFKFFGSLGNKRRLRKEKA